MKECFGYIDNHYPEGECSECPDTKECTIEALKNGGLNDTQRLPDNS